MSRVGKNNIKIKIMEIKNLNKTEFAAIAKQNGNETRQLVIENGVLYEQLTIDEVLYRHKLLSIRALNKEAFDKKAQEVQLGSLPIRLKESAQGEILALVCCGKATLFYHLPACTKERKVRAQQAVFSYAKSLIAKAA